MKTLQVYDGASAMMEAIREYFKGTTVQIQVFMVGDIADTCISYEDFKPVRVVLKELQAKFANLNITEIHRCFSTETQMAILQEMLDADELIYIDNVKGDSIRPIHIGELITERMYNRTVQ